MDTVTDKQLLSSLKRRSGNYRPASTNLVSIIKNEIFFLQAFLDHYRKIGVEQFILIDDKSTDGSLELLCEQPDCVVFQSEFSYGQQITQRARRIWRRNRIRAGIRYKTLLPKAFSANSWCLYVDPDEYLLLPNSLSTLQEAGSALDQKRIRLIASSLVEFYPESIHDIFTDAPPPQSFEDLVKLAPYFDNCPLIEVTNSGKINRLNQSVSGRLFLEHDIPFMGAEKTPQSKQRGIGTQIPIGSATHKIPLHKPNWRVGLKSGHWGTINPSDFLMPCLAHLKFTPDTGRRISEALRSRAWSRGSFKYELYSMLFDSMKRNNSSFMGPETANFRTPHQLEECGNIMYNGYS